MERRAFLAGTLGLLAAPLAADAQPARGPVRVGILSIGAPNLTPTNPTPSRLFPPFLQELRDRGYVEGANLVIEWRFADWRPDRLPALAADLVRAAVDVIVVGGPHGVEAARNVTRSIPIVMVASSDDPVAAGLVASLAQPGGNVTGLTVAVSPEIVGKQLQHLTELVPGLRRVGILADADTPSLRRTWQEFEEAARRLGLQVAERIEVREASQLLPALTGTARTRTHALLVPSAGITFAQRAHVAQLALDSRLLVFAYFRELPEAGGLMSYGPDLRDIYRRAAGYVDRILRGARPADLPVEQPTKFELVINLKTAKTLGLTIPPSVLARADEVIQ